MQRWQGLDEVPGDWGRSVVTIGIFDGVHRGHQAIVAVAARQAAAAGRPLVVVTFDPHPDEVVRPGTTRLTFLTTARRQAELLAGLGVDAVCVLPFTLEFSRLTPDEFVRAVLVEYDFTAEGVPLLADAGRTVSSSEIRELLAAGDVAAAARDLGRPHRVEGIVARGYRRGRGLGFPTANLAIAPRTAIPADGIYAGWLTLLDPDGHEEERWPAAISIGTNPTFGGKDRTVEAYALDRDDLDLYGAHAAVDFTARLRGTVRFDSVDDLVQQMHRDVAEVRRSLEQDG
jgi:riboflavin kinase/FMN adenylyltransferase